MMSAMARRWEGSMRAPCRATWSWEKRRQTSARSTMAASASEAVHDPVEDSPAVGPSRLGQVGVVGGGGDAAMAEQNLHHPDIDPLLEQAGGIAVAEHVRGDTVADPGLGGRGPARGPNHVGVHPPRA